ncbi:Gamma-glutamyl-hercynylcysteine sulfoxide hydrolase [Streptomyces griseorubiginosus]
MCRWLAYSGTPLLLDTILYKPAHSLIDQSLHSRLGVETTNGDGFGVGRYAQESIVLRPCSPRAAPRGDPT